MLKAMTTAKVAKPTPVEPITTIADENPSKGGSKMRSIFSRVGKVLKPIFHWLKGQLTFSKLLVAALVYKGVGWVDQSYALAWAGKTEIASDLSQKALVELLGVALLYAVKATFEQLSKNNTWPDKLPCCDTDTKPAEKDEEETPI